MTPHRIFRWPALCLAASLMLAACAPYRIDIQQGNAVTAEQRDQIRLGMTRDQVRFVLGTPLLTDVFHAQRWDYVYHFRKGSNLAIEQRKLAIWFGKDNMVERIEADAAMNATPPDATGGTRVYDLTATEAAKKD